MPCVGSRMGVVRGGGGGGGGGRLTVTCSCSATCSVNERPLRVATVAYYNIIITCDVIKTVKSLISLI